MRTNKENTTCAGCGMLLSSPRDYHPFAACELFKRLRNGNQVEANLRAVVEYGMRAQASGLSLDDAMHDITKVRFVKMEENL
jgi:hypothetical protein